MAKQEATAVTGKKRAKGWIVFLVILLILAGGVGYVAYSVVKGPLELDDPQALLSAAPMEASDRIRISSDGTARIKLDKADLWHLIFVHAGEDFLDSVNEQLAPNDLAVTGCGIHPEETGLRLDLELRYRETRLAARIPCALELKEGKFSLHPTGVKLGAISLPLEKLLSRVKLEYALQLPVIRNVTGIEYTRDAVLITGTAREDICDLVPQDEKLRRIAALDETYPLADALLDPEGLGKVFAHLEQDPGSTEAFYRQLFVLAGSDALEAYREARAGMTERFFPGIGFSAVEEEYAVLTQSQTALNRSLELFLTKLVNDYNEKNFRLNKGQFYKWGRPFQALQYAVGEHNDIFELLDPESVFLVLVDAQDGFIRKTSSFYRMVDENQEFTREVDFNKTYILGLVFRGVTGDAFLMYETETQQGNTYSRAISTRPLTEEAVSALQEEGKFGVWTDSE